MQLVSQTKLQKKLFHILQELTTLIETVLVEDVDIFSKDVNKNRLPYEFKRKTTAK